MSNQANDFPFTHFFIAGILSILLIFFSSAHKLSWITTSITSIFAPLRSPFVLINKSTNQQINLIRQIPNQSRLIKDLERRNAALSVTASQYELLKSENEALKKIIHSPIAVSHSLLPVRVIGIARYAYIDHGSKDGIQAGQPAVVDSTLLGLVDSVSDSSARIKLLTDGSQTIPVTTSLGSTGSLSFAKDHLEISEVLQKQPLQVDDRVFTSGSELIPSNLLIGTVTAIKPNQSSVYQTAEIKPSANLSDRQILFIVLE